MAKRFVVNPNLEAELNRDPRLRRQLEIDAARAVRAAVQFAPVRTGRYRRSIETQAAQTYGAKGRLRVPIGSTVPYARAIEFGSKRNPKMAPILRGAKAANLRLPKRALRIASSGIGHRR